MRKREEIEELAGMIQNESMGRDIFYSVIQQQLTIEVLLDIRDLLVEQNKPKPQHHEFNISQV